MALLVVTKGNDIGMIQVFNPVETKTINKQKIETAIQTRKARNAGHKTYSREDCSRRNNTMIKERIKTANGYQLFLTLLLPYGSVFNNPRYFSLCMQRFGTWFKNRYNKGYADYWFELSNTNMLHSHINIHTGQKRIDIKAIENECYLKWSSIIKDECKKLCKATQFNKYQLGYMAKKAKRSRSYELMNMFQHKKTYGTFSKKNKDYIQSHLIEINDIQKKRLEDYFINKMKLQALKTNSRLNIFQTQKIKSGFYSQLFLSDIDIACVYYLVFYEELCKIHGEPDSAFWEEFDSGQEVEWPSEFKLEPDDDEQIYGPEDDAAIDAYMAMFEAA